MFKSLIMFLCLLPVAASADTFYIDSNPQGSEVSTTVESLVKTELSVNGHTIVENESNSQWVLRPDTIKLGSTYIVTLSKFQNGKLTYSDKLKSTRLDDLDVVTARLVVGALNNVSASKTRTVDTITDNETKGTTVKTKVTRQSFFGFGPSKVTNLDTSNAGVMLTGGALWGIDHQFSVRAEFTTNNVSKSSAGMSNISIGGQYYFDRKQHAPYAVGSLGYTWAESAEHDTNSSFFRRGKSESGWGIKAGTGMHFYRTATVNIAAELTYNLGLYEVTEGPPGSLGANLIVVW